MSGRILSSPSPELKRTSTVYFYTSSLVGANPLTLPKDDIDFGGGKEALASSTLTVAVVTDTGAAVRAPPNRPRPFTAGLSSSLHSKTRKINTPSLGTVESGGLTP